MAKTYGDLQLKLAQRLGSNAAPTLTAELAKRREWFWEAIAEACGSEEFMWFMKRYATDISEDYIPNYPLPTRFRHPIEIKVNGIIYTKTTKEKFDEEHTSYLHTVTNPAISTSYEYYIYNNELYFSPNLTVQTPVDVTSITQTGGTATITTTDIHGMLAGQYCTIAGANETGYNGDFEILTVPSTTTMTIAVDSGTSSPATGTITTTLHNIEIWYYETATEPTNDASSIILPDEYAYIPVAYAEGRYWSSAHKRGKAADGFTEYESGLAKLKRENFRRKFGQE